MVLFEVPAGEKISSKASKETDDTCLFFDPNKMSGTNPKTGEIGHGKIHFFNISNLKG